MSSLAQRYRAIREMAACCGDPGELDSKLRRIMSAAQSVLPRFHLELLLQRADGSWHPFSAHSDQEDDATSSVRVADSVGSRLSEKFQQSERPLETVVESAGLRTKVYALRVPCDVHKGLLVCVGGRPKPADRDFLHTVSQHIAACLRTRSDIHRSKTEVSQAKKRIEEVSAIYEISQAFDTVDIDALLALVTEKAAAVMDAQACSLMLKDSQRDELLIRASYGLPEQVVENARVPYGEGVAGRVAQTGKPMLLANLRDDPRFADSEVIPRPDIISSICVPLKDEERQVHGVLSIHRKAPAKPFTEDDVRLLSVFASQAALAIANAHLYTSLKERVQELTTLYEASREMTEAYSLEDASAALVRVTHNVAADLGVMLVLFDGRDRGTVQTAKGVSPKLRKAVSQSVRAGNANWMRGLREPLSFSLDSGRRWPSGMRALAQMLAEAFAWVNIVPLVAEDVVIGALILGDPTGRQPEQRRIRLISILASQAASIIKNASRYAQEMDEKVLEMTALYQLSERISTAGSLNEALDSILDIVRDIVRYDESYISTVDYEQRAMTIRAIRGERSHELNGAVFSLEDDHLSHWAIRERKAFVSPDMQKDKRFSTASNVANMAETRSLMVIPLVVHDEVVGLLNVHSREPNLYSEEKVRILSVIASQAAALYKELEALSALANYTDNILRSIAAGVLTIDKDGRVLTWNKAAEDAIGISATEAVGRHFSDIVQQMGLRESDKERILSAISWVLETGDKYLGYKQEFVSHDRGTVYVNMNIAQLRDHNGETLGLVIIFEDVTKDVEMEQEMRRISELAAVGQLAATIAHELRNPLSSIKGAAQYLRKEYSDHASVREFLDIIIEEVNVLNKVTTDFLDFARPTKLNLRETDINDVVFRTVQFMQLDINKQGVEVTQNLGYDLPRIIADDKQLEQVFRNLILNSLQAMSGSGKLSLETSATSDGIRVSVSDTGPGIPEDQLDQIFVPFFTTKTKGTGLGLSIVRKIVENHGGRISVKSQPGHGATFELDLPICSEKARTAIIEAEGAAELGDAGFLRRAQVALQPPQTPD